jgi:flagellar hook-length control protein FliK
MHNPRLDVAAAIPLGTPDGKADANTIVTAGAADPKAVPQTLDGKVDAAKLTQQAADPKAVPQTLDGKVDATKLAQQAADPKAVLQILDGKVDATKLAQQAADPKAVLQTLDGKVDAAKLTQQASDPIHAFGNALKSAVESQAKPSDAQLATNVVQAQPVVSFNQPAASHTISAPLNSSAWSSEFSQKISWLSNQQSQVAELHLNPPDLGPMHVVISVADNQATALFTSPHSEVRNAIENALPKLRESLADNGIMLGNATVSDQTPKDGGAGQFMQQRLSNRVASTIEPSPASTPQAGTRRHTGMLDTFA